MYVAGASMLWRCFLVAAAVMAWSAHGESAMVLPTWDFCVCGGPAACISSGSMHPCGKVAKGL